MVGLFMRARSAWQVLLHGIPRVDPMKAVLDKDGFMCVAEHAHDVAFMMSCMEPLTQHYRGIGGIDMCEVGELIWGYLDGQKTPEEVRDEVKDWLDELKEEAKEREAFKRARDRGFGERFELEQVEDDPEYGHVIDRGSDDDIVDVGDYGKMSDLCDELNNGGVSRADLDFDNRHPPTD